ncbi:hypothetical protein CRG98_033343 [Punica granatum]|uniref:Uncharacterized protein n=1 Tax=Punica granatum TaxID=22663 RepID=A0A2I0IRD2_PUNGR|nr:hypothetical protein CRG98_033343 [Punica granatum]
METIWVEARGWRLPSVVASIDKLEKLRPSSASPSRSSTLSSSATRSSLRRRNLPPPLQRTRTSRISSICSTSGPCST